MSKTPSKMATPRPIRTLPGYKTFTPKLRANLVAPETLRAPAVYTLPAPVDLHTGKPAVRAVEAAPEPSIPWRDYWAGYRPWVIIALTAIVLVAVGVVAWGALEVRASTVVLDRERIQFQEAWSQAQEVIPVLEQEGLLIHGLTSLEPVPDQSDSAWVAHGATFRSRTLKLMEALPPEHARSRLAQERIRKLYVAQQEYLIAIQRHEAAHQNWPGWLAAPFLE